MKREGINVLISLLTAEEQKELELDRESSACEQADVQYLNFPIPDRQVPASRKAFAGFLDQAPAFSYPALSWRKTTSLS